MVVFDHRAGRSFSHDGDDFDCSFDRSDDRRFVDDEERTRCCFYYERC